MLPQKLIEILHTVMTILVQFEQLLRQVLFQFFALNNLRELNRIAVSIAN